MIFHVNIDIFVSSLAQLVNFQSKNVDLNLHLLATELLATERHVWYMPLQPEPGEGRSLPRLAWPAETVFEAAAQPHGMNTATPAPGPHPLLP